MYTFTKKDYITNNIFYRYLKENGVQCDTPVKEGLVVYYRQYYIEIFNTSIYVYKIASKKVILLRIYYLRSMRQFKRTILPHQIEYLISKNRRGLVKDIVNDAKASELW